jgi:predicted membrane-bound spermidine synthase
MMKKLLGIVVLGLFLSSNAYAFNYLFDLGLSSPGGFGGFIMFIIIIVSIFFFLKEGSKEAKKSALMMIGIIFGLPLLFIIIAKEMGIFGFLYLGILASLFYIIPKVAMPKDKKPKVLKRKKRKKQKK